MSKLRDDTFQDRLAGMLLGTAVGDSMSRQPHAAAVQRRVKTI